MKTIYTLILVTLYVTVVSAQIQSVISNGGTLLENEGYSIEYTLGESVIPTLSNNRYTLTQGFHQPDINLSTSTVDYNGSSFTHNIYPNPFVGQLNISLIGNDTPVRKIEVHDIHGRLVSSGTVDHLAEQWNLELSSLTDGLYVIILKDGSGVPIHTSKALKIR